MLVLKKIILPCAQMFPLVEQLMAEGMRVRFTVSGSSMWPLIRHNTDSVLLAYPDHPVHKGDIVLIKYINAPAGYILHRAVRLSATSIITAGDNCITMDTAVPLDCIIGRVDKIYRGSHTIDCSVYRWRLLFGLWRILFPCRRILLKCLRILVRIRAKVHNSVKGFVPEK